MARRYNLKNIQDSWQKDVRQSIGDTHVDSAITSIKQTMQKAIALQTSYEPSRQSTLSMLFDDEDIAKLSQVRGMVKTEGNTRDYDIENGVTLTIGFAGALVPAIEPHMLKLNYGRIQPLMTYISEVKAIHDKFEEVKGLLRWMNRNATPGAIRYYWPTAMELTPKAPVWNDYRNVPSRYSTPPDIGDWLQVIKDAATTVAGSLMLPGDIILRQRDKMWLTFKTRKVELSNVSFYNTDEMVYNI